MTERYDGPLDPPYDLLRQFVLETPEALKRMITVYFIATPDDPHAAPESDIIGLFVDWLDRRGDSEMAFVMSWAAMANALHEARQEDTP